LLIAVFLLIAAAMVWQETRATESLDQPIYVLAEAARFIYPQLSDAAIDRLDIEDVARILEWEVAYLQGVSPRGAGGLQPVRVAGSEDAATFVQSRLSGLGYDYAKSDIEEVLYHEGTYLIEIGAVAFDTAEEE
jgi:hypothetical protein